MNLVTVIYDILAIAEIGVLLYVIRQVDNDRINNLDKPWVRQARKVSFSLAELFLCFTIYTQGWMWEPSWVVVGLIGLGDFMLFVNVISLHHRAPPGRQSGIRLHSAAAVRRRTIL